MKRRTAIMVILLLISGVSLTVRTASAQDPGYYPVDLAVGESFDMCNSGAIVCPASSARCDDPKIAMPVDLPGGMGLKGVSPGSTLCSAGSAAGPRRVFRITVR